MREMQEIESQRSAVPPVPASKVKDHLKDDAWALQYIEDGKIFNVCLLTFNISLLYMHCKVKTYKR